MYTPKQVIDKIFHAGVYQVVLSVPGLKSEKYKKITFRKLKNGKYQSEKFTQTQAFHETLSYDECKAQIFEFLGTYREVNSWDEETHFSVKISKKGKMLLSQKKTDAAANEGKAKGQSPKKLDSHNREKNYLLKQGETIAPLIDMGIFTKEGKVVQAKYDKYRQINRFVEIIDDEVKKLDKEELTILDFGCGKSYLTFILYHYFTQVQKRKVKMIGLDLKADVIEKCNAAARKYGYFDLHFQVGDIGGFDYKDKVDIVITLHACDTATDFALYNAICWKADMIFSVPCCQHELNGQIESNEFSLLTRYGILKERFSSLLTDGIRANLLEHCGYKTQLVEFVAFDHTPKNIMLRAVRKKGKGNSVFLREAETLVKEFHAEQTLYRLLKESGRV